MFNKYTPRLTRTEREARYADRFTRSLIKRPAWPVQKPIKDADIWRAILSEKKGEK